MNKIFKKFLVFLSIFFLAQNLLANEKIDLEKQFTKKLDEVVLVVKDRQLTAENRNANIINLLTPMFDFKLMAKLSLGKSTWNKLTLKEQDNFIKLYVVRMKKSYSSKVDSYKNQEIEIKEVSQKKNRIRISTDIIGKDDSFEIIYKFYKPKKRKENKDIWLIYDVEIIGISILKADKAQFKEFLKTKSISQLINKLAKK
ncbi:MAG: hypothetical protein COB17_04520 [Sulfurimonas sp.]|nr:MAG: hypothetical protein COB17_04520 [Sulfurimonas sp.]